MPIDTTKPQSPGWWLNKLMGELAGRQSRYNRMDRYYRGEADLPAGAEHAREAYQRVQRKCRTNFAGLIVEAVRERMQPVGFRTGAEGDQQGDDEARRIWEANGLDSDWSQVARASLSMSDAYMMVGGVDKASGAPLITPEDPRQVITAHDPRNKRRVVAALKVFTDDLAGADLAYLYLPGVVFRAVRRSTPLHAESVSPDGWEWYGPEGGEALPDGRVPVVRFPNRADLAGNTLGEFEDVVDILDRINLTLLQRVTIAAMQAFRQRGIKGDLPEVDSAGDDIDYDNLFRADPGALWQLPSGVDLWESGTVDLTPLLSSIRHDVQDVAAVTRTPLFYLTPDAASGSAEGASLSREGLTFKATDRINAASDPLEQVMSLAFTYAGDPVRASRPDLEVLWAPPERFSLAERYDAASKAQAAGVPWEAVMQDVLQFSPAQIGRMQIQRLDDALASSPTAAGGSDIKAKADAMGVLIRSGVDPESAAREAGLIGLDFTGAVPGSLRLPEVDAQNLEGGTTGGRP